MRFHYALVVLLPLASAQVVSTASAGANSVLTQASSGVNSVLSTASEDVNSVLSTASMAVNSVLSAASSVLTGSSAPGVRPAWFGGKAGDMWGLGMGAVVAGGLLGGGLFL